MLFSKILERLSLLFGIPIRVEAKTFWGENMIVIIPELVSLNIFRYGFYEEGLTRMLLEHLKQNMTFFDIGAHFGYFSLLASYLVGDSGQVHVFEPTPSSFDILRINVLNKTNIFLNKNAVFSQRQTVSLNDYGDRYSAFNSIYTGNLPPHILARMHTKRYQVTALSVDEYVRQRGVIPDFVKVDAENAEYDILKGMEMTIEEYHPMISIEVGDINVKDGASSKKLINYLVERGYKSYQYRKGRIELHLIRPESYQYDNILFLRE
jgi:FkbM family methyltransferase